MSTVEIGCSGWMYEQWRGSVYPWTLPKSRWLEAYAERFETVEVNSTFYRLPPRTAVEQWASRVPPSFCFSFKLGQFGSHRMKLRDPAGWLPNHLDRVSAAGARMGPTLVQLPARWRPNPHRLDEFLAVASPSVRWAIEFRNPEWLQESIYEVLRRHGAALCIHDLIADHPRVLTTDWTYVRFHGPNATKTPYHGSYGRERLQEWATWLGDLREQGCDVYAYFNNDADAAAVGDAAVLRKLVG
ncbi:DUF72 domain-containing protein [Smaragdicoccus niigatensis]|uniref:DUF72 domain-containing protein n=1 Tax=Smaragdicoccus niigatensis TaxID=359359 RepID=UPI00036A3256|nr:DUF72 domain-containing protein [Smaragdicoccus niigatensis]